MRIGFGYDTHRLKTGRRLIIGGVEVPYTKGLYGHSDADVLIHAIIDSLLGAACLGDIGMHFPPTEPAYKDISSIELLDRTAVLLGEKGYAVENIDSTVVCEAPKLKGHIPAMVEKMASTLGCDPSAINVKAKTDEGLGFRGRGEGISAYAVSLIKERK